MRIFVAVEIPEAIRHGLSRLQDVLADRGLRDVRRVVPSGIHLTLRFCGEIPPETVRFLSEMLSPGAPFPAFSTTLDGLGVFPLEGPPRVLVVRIGAGSTLLDLARWVEERVRDAGLPAETRPFRAHLTLARFRPGAGPPHPDRMKIPEDLRNTEIPVERFVLFQSHLELRGARYEPLKHFPLLGFPPP